MDLLVLPYFPGISCPAARNPCPVILLPLSCLAWHLFRKQLKWSFLGKPSSSDLFPQATPNLRAWGSAHVHIQVTRAALSQASLSTDHTWLVPTMYPELSKANNQDCSGHAGHLSTRSGFTPQYPTTGTDLVLITGACPQNSTIPNRTHKCWNKWIQFQFITHCKDKWSSRKLCCYEFKKRCILKQNFHNNKWVHIKANSFLL